MPTTIDPRDALLQRTCPIVPVPKFGELDRLEENGHRFLAASNGLWLELRRPWLYLLHPVGGRSEIAMPYGEIEAQVEYAFDLTAHAAPLLAQFVQQARAALPNESAGWIVWNEEIAALEYLPCLAISAGPGGIEFRRPHLYGYQHLAIDVHSHGTMPAFFSGTDDDDDAGDVKIAIVVGRLDQPELSMAKRLCALGLMLDIGVARCRKCGCTDDRACGEGCYWVEPDLCSACMELPA